MRVVVAHNWHLSLDPYAAVEGKPYPPLGTAILAAMLRERGHEVVFHDATFADGPEAFAGVLDAVRPDRALIVADHFLVPQKMCLDAQRRGAFAMLSGARTRKIPVLIAGPDASDRAHEYLAAGADVVVRGEPDASALAWADGAEAASLPGAVVPGGAVGDVARPMTDLGGLPSPAWDLLDLRPYADTWRRVHGAWEAPVSASRGCPYRCNWCAKPIWGRRIALRPVADVLADVAQLERAGVDRIWFADDIFGIKPAWLRDFRDAVRARGGMPPFRCLSRADLLAKPGAIDLLAEAGCAEVWMGAESGSQRVLDAMDKDQDVAEIEVAVRGLRARGVRVGLFLQLGYPGERVEDVQQTFAMIRRLRPDEIGISVTLPLPGTPFYERVKDRLLAESWDSTMDCRLLFQATYPQPFYDAAREVLRREHAVAMAGRAAVRLMSGERGPKGRRHDLRRVAAAPLHAARVPFEHLRVAWWATSER